MHARHNDIPTYETLAIYLFVRVELALVDPLAARLGVLEALFQHHLCGRIGRLAHVGGHKQLLDLRVEPTTFHFRENGL